MSYSKSVISGGKKKMVRHSGYGREIEAYPIDVIPVAAQNSETIFTKHVYPHKQSTLRRDFNRKSNWAPRTEMG